MAGYLKVLSSLSRSAAAFSRNPAVLAPAANIQSVPQRNGEWRQITGVILSIIVFTVDLCFMVTGGLMSLRVHFREYEPSQRATNQASSQEPVEPR